MAKWALITGATSGIGWATAITLATRGYSILATGRRQEKLQELQKEIKTKNPQVEVQVAAFDLCSKTAVQSFLSSHANTLQQVHILVNNAGLARGVDKMQNGSLDDWDEMIDTNIKGLLYMTRGVIPYLEKNNRGHVVNLGSIAGRYVYPGGGVYCATKFAVRALTEGLRMDLAGSSIRVTNIEPGMVETEFSLSRFNGNSEMADKVYEGMTPLKAQDIADTIAWCIDRPSHVNIQELVIYPVDQAHVGQVVRRN